MEEGHPVCDFEVTLCNIGLTFFWCSAGTAFVLLQIHNSGQQQYRVKNINSHEAVLLSTDNATDVLQLCKALICIFVLCVHCILHKLHCLLVKFDWLCVPPLTTVAYMQHDEDAGQR